MEANIAPKQQCNNGMPHSSACLLQACTCQQCIAVLRLLLKHCCLRSSTNSMNAQYDHEASKLGCIQVHESFSHDCPAGELHMLWAPKCSRCRNIKYLLSFDRDGNHLKIPEVQMERISAFVLQPASPGLSTYKLHWISLGSQQRAVKAKACGWHNNNTTNVITG